MNGNHHEEDNPAQSEEVIGELDIVVHEADHDNSFTREIGYLALG